MSRGWGQRWSGVLDAAPAADARRIQRGQGLSRRGAVSDVRIEPGRIRGTVREDRGVPCQVRLGWSLPSESTWDAAIAALAAELRFTAALLDGRLPTEVADTLAEVGVPLLPTLTDLQLACTGDPDGLLCRHVAAVHTAVAASVERDPFLLLRFRGRDRDRLLEELRSRRGGGVHDPADDLDLSRGLYHPRGDLDGIELHPAPVEDPSALFQRLGPPPGVDDVRPYVRTIERAAEGAWRLAAGEGADAADVELLLHELRAQRVATAASLATALARDEDAIRAELDRLFEAGTVLRTGSGDRARYRASS